MRLAVGYRIVLQSGLDDPRRAHLFSLPLLRPLDAATTMPYTMPRALAPSLFPRTDRNLLTDIGHLNGKNRLIVLSPPSPLELTLRRSSVESAILTTPLLRISHCSHVAVAHV